VAILPWAGFVLIGIYLESVGLHKKEVKEYRAKRYVLFLGRKSLSIYFIHQMVLFPFCFLLHKIFH
jgi:uncharacterized membrane protein